MSMISERAQEIIVKLDNLKNQLIDVLIHGKSGANLSHKELRAQIYKFANQKPTVQERAALNQHVRLNIREFIRIYIQPKIKGMIERNDAYYFVQTLTNIWAHFQRFIFAQDFALEKFRAFFESFHKMNNAKKFDQKGEVVPVPIIAVNELKVFFEQQKHNILKTFPRHFCYFISQERQGKQIPRDLLKQSMVAVQSCFFDFQAIILLDYNKKPTIVKNPRGTENIPRKSSDSKYFEQSIIKEVLRECTLFYERFVKQKLPKVNPTDQLDVIMKILAQQQARSSFYIHTPDNQKKYIQTVNNKLIGHDLSTRINRQNGLKKFLRQYQVGKPEFKNQLTKFWKIFSRILSTSLPQIVNIYCDYLDEEAVLAERKIEKFSEFIPQVIRINTKNIKIVEFFGKNFQLENKRNQKIRSILSNDIVKDSKFKGKHTMGAFNLAKYVDAKFKEFYGKGIEVNQQIVNSFIDLFKILQQKVNFTKEHEKCMATRLLEETDFSEVNDYSKAIELQKKFVDAMQKEMGVSEVKQLSKNIKDVQKSYDNTKIMKDKHGQKLHELNQVIIKTNTFWPEKNTFDITPPTIFLRIATQVVNYFSQISKVQFEYNGGVSVFRGTFKSKVPKQIFRLKNMYTMILFMLDEAQDKKMYFADLKTSFKSYGNKKDKGNLQLLRSIIELMNIGLIKSPTKVLDKQDPNGVKLSESDQFQLNPQFDFDQSLKNLKINSKFIKKTAIIRSSQIIQFLPEWIRKLFVIQMNVQAQDQVLMEKYRQIRIKQIAVKLLKQKDYSFENLYAEYYKEDKYKQFRVTEKGLKQTLEEMISEQLCERVEGQRNVFHYTA